MVGTPGYMAPEMYSSLSSANPNEYSDIWSCGCTILLLYTACSLQSKWQTTDETKKDCIESIDFAKESMKLEKMKNGNGSWLDVAKEEEYYFEIWLKSWLHSTCPNRNNYIYPNIEMVDFLKKMFTIQFPSTKNQTSNKQRLRASATQLLQHSWLKRVVPDDATQLNSGSPEIINSASDEEWANELVTRNFPAVMNGLKHRRNATKCSTTIIEIDTLMMHEYNNFYECLMDATYTKYYKMYNASTSFISTVSGSYSEFLRHLDLDRWLLYRKKNQANKSKDTPSYAPTVVRALETLKSITPDANMFTCPAGQINVKTKNGYECKSIYDDSPEIKEMMLKNLNIEAKKINYDLILAPRQSQSNCWFNVFFMVFFISDKGRKFFRYLRKSMITGILPNKQPIDQSMKTPFFLLNLFIEASFLGKNDPAEFGEIMNTNFLIKHIGDALKTKNLHNYEVYEVGQAGNPINYYHHIMKYLDNDIILMKSATRRIMNRKNIDFFLNMDEKIPDILYVNQISTPSERNDDDYGLADLKEVYNYVIKDKKVTYKLDSAIIISQDKCHYTAYITGNGKQYAFDGASFARLIPFEWKNKINTEITWKFSEDMSSIFDFNSCSITFFYYRI